MIPIHIPYIYRASKDYVSQAMEAGEIAQGPFIKRFEEDFAVSCGREYGVTCSNGTVALYMAIKALDLPRESEVILPSMTIISCLTAVLENGLVPVFCDIDPTTYNIDFDSAQSKVGPNTSAIIVVNTYGLMVDVDRLAVFRSMNPHIKVIEDASESHGAYGVSSKSGGLGDVSTYSFYSNKIVTMGEGGIVLTDDPAVNDRLMQIRNLHFIDRKKYIHETAGFNFRLTNLQCAVGLGQLAHIEETITQRKRVAYLYNKYFADIDGIQTPTEPAGYSNVYWYYGIQVKKNYTEVLNNLEAADIEYRHFFHPLHKQPFINSTEVLINSEKCFENGILLPIFNILSEEQIKYIATTIKQAL